MVDFNEIEKNKNSPDFGIMSIAVRDYYKLFFEGESIKYHTYIVHLHSK